MLEARNAFGRTKRDSGEIENTFYVSSCCLLVKACFAILALYLFSVIEVTQCDSPHWSFWDICLLWRISNYRSWYGLVWFRDSYLRATPPIPQSYVKIFIAIN